MVVYLFQKGKYMTKKIGLSLVAATLLTSSMAMAFEDTQVTGGMKLWYQTQSQSDTDKDFLDREASIGDLVANLGITSKANDHIGVGMKMYAATTLGLEENVVSNETLSNATSGGGVTGAVLNGENANPYWLGEAYMTYTASNTVVKIGRQELDTPLAYTEKWNAAPNTFEATAIINNDVPDTTIVAAFVSRGNGHFSGASGSGLTTNANTVLPAFNSYWEGVTDGGNILTTKDRGGAYALGILNKSSEMVPVNIWLYDVLETATATWVDATIAAGPVKVLLQGANVAPTGATQTFLDTTAGESQATTAMAAKVSATFGEISAYGAFSSVSAGNLPVANTATGFKKTKLCTASIFSDGMYAAQPDTASMKLGASMKMGEASSLAVSYGTYTIGKNEESSGVAYTTAGSGKAGADLGTSEIDVVFKTKVSDINLAAMYINQAAYTKLAGDEIDRSFIRVIAGIDF